MQNQANTNQASANQYFDLHTTGIGYLSRVRTVDLKAKGRNKAQSFLACSIAAFFGESNNVNYTYYDVKVVGEKAIEVVNDLMEAANDKDRKVIIVFSLGDLYVDTFTYTKGENAGKVGFQLKGRLLKIKMAKVDGQVVYKEALDAAETPAENDREFANEHTGTEG